MVRGLGIGDFHRVVAGIHRRLSDFIHAAVVHRRDEAIREEGERIREDPIVHPYRWLRSDFVPPSSLSSVSAPSYAWRFLGAC